MRIFTVGELYGPLSCEYVTRQRRRCGRECYSILLTAAENAELPVKTGPEAVNHIFVMRLGKAGCGRHMGRMEEALKAKGETVEDSFEMIFEEPPNPPSPNLVWCPHCDRGVGEEECSINGAPKEKGEERFEVTHKDCRKPFVVGLTSFYRRGGKPPHQRNPFFPLHISL